MTFYISSMYRFVVDTLSSISRNKSEMPSEVPLFGAKEWKNVYNIDVGKEPPIPPTLLKAWQDEACPFWPDKKVKETHILALVPKKADGESLDLYKILEYAQKALPQSQQCMKPYIIKETIQPNLSSYEEAYWVLVTKVPVPETSGLSQKNQADHIQKQANNNYSMVSTMEGTTSILAAFANDVHIFGPDLKSYTQCRETVDSHPIRVGITSQGTLNYTYPAYSPINCGAAAVRTL